MRMLLAVAAFLALSGPAMAQGGVNGGLSVTPPGASHPYAHPYSWRDQWRSHHYWRSAHRWQGLPRYAQPVPDYYWPGPQNWPYTPGPL